MLDFGVEKETTTLDDSGSTVTVERKWMNSTIVKPVRRYYEHRVKVKDKKEEFAEYIKFSDGLTKDKLDPAFRVEHTKHGDETGYYFVVKCYTTLDYGKEA
jgi:hypothetical protein